MKKNILLLLVLTIGLASCMKDTDYTFPKDKYYYDVPQTDLTEDVIVGALYHTIGETYWNYQDKGYTNTPALGEYDVFEDEAVLKQQLEWAKKAGIDFLTINWGGYGNVDTLMWKFHDLYTADNQLPKIVLKYDVSHLTQKSKLDNEEQMKLFIAEFDSLNTHLFTKDSYFRLNDKPVVTFFGYTANNGAAKSWKTVIDKLHESMKEKGHKEMWTIGEIDGSGWTSPERWNDTIPAFDAVYTRTMATDNWDVWYSYWSFIDQNKQYWKQYMESINKEFIPYVEPAFNNTIFNETSNAFIVERKKELYNHAANVGKRNITKSRIILISSWNDYREGTSIEPTDEYREDYLEWTKEFFSVKR